MSNNKKRGCGCLKVVLYLAALIFVFVQLCNLDIIPLSLSDNSVPSVQVDDSVCDFYYEQLNATEQQLYGSLLQTARNGKLKCTLSDVDADAFADATDRAVRALFYDHPELFWLDGGWQSTSNSLLNTITVTMTTYDFWDYVYDKQKYINAFETAVSEVVNAAEAYTSSYEKAEFVHNYLAYNNYYDYDRLEESQKTFHTASSEYIYSAYSALMQDATVCSGYAKAYQAIMNRLGYVCTYVSGDAGGPHAWNYIELDGDGYFLDLTWNDADWRDDNGALLYPDDAKYDYFLITTKEISKTHTLNTELFTVPNCTATKYNYHRYNGYYTQTYSFDKVKTAFEKQADSTIISVKFASVAELNAAKAHFIDKGYWSKVPSLNGKKISYVTNENLCTLTVLK